jgi:phage terminase Nu1 subunit (DNA packaging protein)
MYDNSSKSIDRVYSRKQLAALLGVCTKTIQRLDEAGAPLGRVAISDRRIGYRSSAVAAYLNARTR